MLAKSKVKVVACSGMGKVYGLMAREAALQVITRLCRTRPILCVWVIL